MLSLQFALHDIEVGIGPTRAFQDIDCGHEFWTHADVVSRCLDELSQKRSFSGVPPAARLSPSPGFSCSPSCPITDMVKVPRMLIEHLTDTLCYAA